MNVKLLGLGISLGALAFSAAGAASSAIVITLEEAGGSSVHSTPGLSSSTVTGLLNGSEVVTLSTAGPAPNTITTGGGGASTYSGPFDDFLISFVNAKSIVGFNLEFFNPPRSAPTQTTGVSIFVNGNLYGTFANPIAAPQKFTITASVDGVAGNDDVIDSVLLTFQPNVIGSVKQIRATGAEVSAAVPEPATWAMMILGFGGVGALMRRRFRFA